MRVFIFSIGVLMIKEDFLWTGGPRFLFDTELFPPGTDSFALGYFAAAKSGERVCDLGSGTGLLGMLLLARQGALHIANVELSAAALDLAEKNFAANGWLDRASFCCGDLRDANALPAPGSIDRCISNPPYFKSGSGESSPHAERRQAREENTCSLDDVCAAVQRILRWGGSFCLVHRPDRLVDIFCSLRAHAIEPKRVRFVLPRSDAAPSLVLIEGRRGGKPGLVFEPPLVIGSPEWDAVYFR